MAEEEEEEMEEEEGARSLYKWLPGEFEASKSRRENCMTVH